MSPVDLALVAVLAPLAVAVVLLVLAPARRLGTPAAVSSVLAALVSTGASFTLLWQQVGGAEAAGWSIAWLPRAGHSLAEIGVQVDGISAVMLSVVALVALCVQVFSLEYMRDEPPAGRGRYFTWQSLFLFSMQALVIAPNLLQLFLAWELVGLCSYLLIGFWYRKPAAAQAAIKAFWMTKLADLGLILGLILQYTVAGSFAWDPAAVAALSGAGALGWVVALYFVAVMGKSAQFPLHVWLPDAMEGPTPVSALLHAATMVAAGVYLVVRAWPLFAAAEAVLPAISVIGGVTALFAACVAVVQTDIKRVLAYSTISQLGYMVAALGAGGLFAGYFHLGTHAFFKALLFLAAGSVIHAVHSNEVGEMGGLRRTMPLTTVVFVIGAAALAGLPLFSGYFSKDAVLLSLQHATGASPVYWVPLVACVGTVFLTAFYMARVVFRAFFGEPVTEAAAHAHEGGWALIVPMLLLAAGSVGVGWAGGYLAVLADVHHEVHFDPLHLSAIGVIGVVLGLSGIAASWALDHRGMGRGVLEALAPLGRVARSGAVDRAWVGAYRRGLLALSAGVAWFDRYVIDGVINVTAALGLAAGERSRGLQTGRPGDYVLVVVLGVIVLAAWSQLQDGLGLSGVIW